MSIADQLEAAGERLSPAVRVALVALEGRGAVLEAEVLRLGAENRALREQLRDLQARLDQNSTNSSLPPSADPPGVLRRKKKPSGRKRGGQPGHPGAYRTLLAPERVDRTLEVRPARCRHCGADLAGAPAVGRPVVQQMVELPPLRAEVTEHRAFCLACPACGKTTRAQLPPEVARHRFGPRLVALATWLLGRFRVSRRNLGVLLSDLLDVPAPALGSTQAFAREAAGALLSAYRAVRRRVRRSAAAGVDETGWKLRGRQRWVWAAVAERATLFHLGSSRSSREVRRLLGSRYAGVVTSDRWSAYRVCARRQLCWAHLARNLEGLALRGGVAEAFAAWGTAECQRVFSLWHEFERHAIDRPALRRCLVPLQARFGRLLGWGADLDDRKVAAFCRNLRAHWAALWTFARADVAPTNNAAERALRGPVIWRKTSFGSSSGQGMRFVERILSVVETCRQHDLNPLSYLTSAIVAHRQNAPAPRLLPIG